MSNTVTLPAGSTLGKSFEYGCDINVGTSSAPVWQPFRRISGFLPSPTPVAQDSQTYDDRGTPNSDVTAWSMNLAFNAQVNRNVSTGLYLPEIEAVLARTGPDAIGESAVLEARWYHKPAVGTPNPTDAGQGFFTVIPTRQNSGPAGEIEVIAIALTGKGEYEKITNPYPAAAATVPTLTSITPSGKSIGDQVTITGTGFIGVTQLKFDAIVLDVDTYTVVSAATIIATIPPLSAGIEPVTITNATGVSSAVNYTVVS
ncbi:phage tail tube protein [Cryobacterium sp. Y11]|uniref:phage tail tube protein n=1 Tax=Cryobacterium sp. Y11 TaxID=2045016 RepID=UPI000CE3D39D|nr:IPT/TIG domain-containing protein [Cryobacterium sp. Y11]